MSGKLTMSITMEDEEAGDEFDVVFPAKYKVCDDCDGAGTHLNPNMRNHAYSQEEFQESFDDEEAEQYFTRGGIYDVTCESCKGLRVRMIIDEDACDPSLKELLAQYNRQAKLRAQWKAEDAYNRRYGF